MEMQKNNIKIIIVLLIIVISSFPLNASNNKRIYIATEINGKCINDVPILRDGDSCRFFIIDEKEKVVDLTNREVKWTISFKNKYGYEKFATIGTNIHKEIELCVRAPFFGFYFVNESAETSDVQQNGILTCVIDGQKCVREIKMDVIPQTPEIKIVNQREESDAYSNTYPVVTLEIFTSSFEYGCIEVDDLDVPPYLIAINGTDKFPLLIEAKGGVFLCGFRFHAHNGYGMSISNKVYSDILPTIIKTETQNEPTVVIQGSLLDIHSSVPINNISVINMFGEIVFHKEGKIYSIKKYLTRGFYILSFTKNNGSKILKKILIK